MKFCRVQRKMTFQQQWQQLQNAYSQNRLSHAYLLSGVADLGKTDFACAFAKWLLCENHSSCGHCHSCQWMQANTHPDFMLIQPSVQKHSIKIDQIRAVSDKLSRTAQQGGYQVVIISPADAMPIQAANALLKTLEEPAGKIIIFLVDDQRSILPATIISRCQKIFFTANHLDLRMHDNTLMLRDQVLTHLLHIQTHRVSAINFNSTLLKTDLGAILQQCLLVGGDVSRVQEHVTQDRLIHHDAIDRLSAIAAKISPFALQEWIKKCFEKKSIISRGINLNQQLCLEDVFIEWEMLCS